MVPVRIGFIGFGEVASVFSKAMRGIGVDPLMTSATKAFFKRSFSLGLKGAFPEKPGSFEEVVNFMEKQLGRNLGEE